MSYRPFVPAVLWMVIIFLLSVIPGEEIPEFSLWGLLSFDKLVHVFFFIVLSFQVMKGCIRQSRQRVLKYNSSIIAIAVGIVYGGFMEIYQEMYLIDRYGDWLDFTANVIGTLAGVILFRIIFFEYIR